MPLREQKACGIQSMERSDTLLRPRRDETANKSAAANRRYVFKFMSHGFYNLIGFGKRALLHPLHPPQGY
jgi:hypothetical protein